MKKHIARLAAALVASLLLIAGFGAVSASAATVGNVVCNSSNSTTTLRVNYTTSTGAYVVLSPGRCSNAGAQAFTVDVGEYCVSPWGYVYNGPGWWLGLPYYKYTISGNNQRLTYTCRPA